jgi:hypothetical protein
VTPQSPGVLVAHDPVSSPGNDVGLTLRDDTQASGARVGFDRTPRRDMPDVPGTVKVLFVGVVRVSNGSGDS